MSVAGVRSTLRFALQVTEVIWPFVAALILLLALDHFRGSVMSAMRAYVGGESLWSKGQKDAYFHLDRYARTLDEKDYRAFRHAIAVPLGDRVAREELDKAYPDLAVARNGFIAGGNDPADVDAMIWLFRTFRHYDGIAKAVDIWSRADVHIAELNRTASALHDCVRE